MAIGDIYQATIKAQLQGQACENVFHYRVTADADGSALEQGLFNHMRDTIIGTVKAGTSSGCVWNEIRVQKIWPLPARVPLIGAISIAGEVVAAAMPAEVAFVVSTSSFFAGRAYRGRKYYAGLPFSYFDPSTGLWNSAAQIAWAPVESAMIINALSSPPSGIMEPIIYHRLTHTATLITKAVQKNIPRVQRRRQIGRGI